MQSSPEQDAGQIARIDHHQHAGSRSGLTPGSTSGNSGNGLRDQLLEIATQEYRVQRCPGEAVGGCVLQPHGERQHRRCEHEGSESRHDDQGGFESKEGRENDAEPAQRHRPADAGKKRCDDRDAAERLGPACLGRRDAEENRVAGHQPGKGMEVEEADRIRIERIALDWNRGAIPRGPWERVNPLGQTKESVFSQPEHASLRPRRAGPPASVCCRDLLPPPSAPATFPACARLPQALNRWRAVPRRQRERAMRPCFRRPSAPRQAPPFRSSHPPRPAPPP